MHLINHLIFCFFITNVFLIFVFCFGLTSFQLQGVILIVTKYVLNSKHTLTCNTCSMLIFYYKKLKKTMANFAYTRVVIYFNMNFIKSFGFSAVFLFLFQRFLVDGSVSKYLPPFNFLFLSKNFNNIWNF